MNMEKEIANLSSKNAKLACYSFDKLVLESDKTDSVYMYWNVFVEMLSSKNAYIRMRALSLISINSQWDSENKLKSSLPLYLERLNDDKPIVIRICLKRLYNIIENAPNSIPEIKKVIENMNLNNCRESMINVISKDRKNLLSFITTLE